MVFLGIEQNLIGGAEEVRTYYATFGWDFPAGLSTYGGQDIFGDYATARDNYMIIGRDGTVVFRANSSSIYTGNEWTSQKNQLIAALNQLVPTEPLTWSRVKALYP